MGNPVVHWELMSKQPAKTAGGKIHVESQAVPGMGKLCLFTDPEGRMMGLWKAKT